MLAKVSPKGLPAALSATKTVTGNVHFSSKTVEWPAPQWLYDKLDLEFHFMVDLCATPEKRQMRVPRAKTVLRNRGPEPAGSTLPTGDRLVSGSRKRVMQHYRVQQSLRLSPRERTRNGSTALSRPRARFDICRAACVPADANIPRRSRARSQFGSRPDDHLYPSWPEPFERLYR